MVIVVTSKYRMEAIEEVAEIYFRMRKENPMPAFMKRIGPFFTTDHDQGLTALHVYELPKNKLTEGLLWSRKSIAVYKNIPGCTISSQAWTDLEETTKAFGISLPKL